MQKTNVQKEKANKCLYPRNDISDFDLKPPFAGEWYWAFFLDKFSKTIKPSIKINRKKDNWFANDKSSNEIHALYIPVVNVEIPKNDTEPKSESVSIATNESPATIAGLADGKIILKNDFFLENPRFLPNSIKFWDW